MKEELELVFQILSKINDKYDKSLIDPNKLEDVKENNIDSLAEDFSKWDNAISCLSKVDITKDNLEDEENYRHGIAYLGMSLIDISNDLKELYDILGELNQNMQKD
ncbi:hypothetical protein BCR24_15155 [Enterococcus ureilyticus]|uniref:Uncharacterized protein n=3 Tax=Enterococcus ureilyticus TaxID=1131292 RepID=A0A1E5HC57_9ENTE|nr:hypothetical protein [Enterococcus ureilyticus]OEG22542.1 hypothetical protein BCR24_15155 [Enterococcus ureilyticus]